LGKLVEEILFQNPREVVEEWDQFAIGYAMWLCSVWKAAFEASNN
jgi:hypothetical protein